ncbi:DUF1410 domain-containing protein [Ureaplasma parvum]|uniref:Uncharacterized protein n=1 Tax=Ureaplasma parvum serovar 3 (strain ATCC 27815 / 27 / NCTC 11736) TaxID=505682 RepID=A0A2C9DXY4_UREP2|nr:DUF1410 domain-containing protein [Ureaplasma parvum]ACA32711.1 conserved hypothetical protein [Ureaplasma parvum serovar 3 str. ATCC 27815]
MNYQTEKVNFEAASAPSQQPSPTPAPKTEEPKENGGSEQQADQPENSKKDDVVASGVKISEVKNNTATIEVTFSKFELADANKKDFVLEVIKKADTNPIQASDLKYDEASKTLSGKLSGLNSNVDYEISKLTLNGKEVKFNEEELLKSYVKNAKLFMTFNKENKKINVKLQNFDILNSLEENQPILTFDIEIKKDSSLQVVHKSLTKNQLSNLNGLEIDLKDKMNGNNANYDVKLTNAKLLNVNIETQK